MRTVTSHGASHKPVGRVVLFPRRTTFVSLSRPDHRGAQAEPNAHESFGNHAHSDGAPAPLTGGAVLALPPHVRSPDYSNSYAVAAVILLCLGGLVSVVRAASALPQLAVPRVLEQQDEERRPDRVSPTLTVDARSRIDRDAP